MVSEPFLSFLKGSVTTPTVRMPFFLDILATTGAAPVPVPPPIPAVMKSIWVPSSAFSVISSAASKAAFLPLTGSVPAPSSPMRIFIGTGLAASD